MNKSFPITIDNNRSQLGAVFSWCLLTGEKRSLPWVENGFDLTAVRSLFKGMLLPLFADGNLSPLRLARHTLIPLSCIELIDVLERVQS